MVKIPGRISMAYMKFSAEKTTLMTNNTNGIGTYIMVNRKNMDRVHSLKYLGTIVTDGASMPEIVSRIAQTNQTIALHVCI